MKKYFLFFVVIAGMFLSISSVRAADEAAAVVDEDLEYTYGSIVSSSVEQILVSEYNYETDEEVQTTYLLNGETKFTNIAAATDLVKDDNVDVYYKIKDGKKLATVVTKDDTVYESEYSGEGDGSNVPVDSVGPQSNSEIQNQNAVSENAISE